MQKFKDRHGLPRFTDKGFQVVDLPKETQDLIFDFYKLLKPHKSEENWDNIHKSIHNKQGLASVDFFDLSIAPSWIEVLQAKIKPLLETWINQPESLKLYSFYGIRSYQQGMLLEPHYDRSATHHISAIIIVDREGENWPLDIQDHDGNWNKVYAEPGQIILYESAVCKHGRIQELEGKYFANCYMHFSLTDWLYTGQETWSDYMNDLVDTKVEVIDHEVY